MWEKLLMNVSCLSAIILTIVGLAKLFFKKFKAKFPKWYKTTFFLLSLALVVGGSIIAQLYIIGGKLATVDFALLIMGTAVVVLGGYQGYECTNLKTAIHSLWLKLKTWLSSYSDSKVAKMIKKVGIEKIDAIANTLTIKPVEVAVVSQQGVIETIQTDSTMIIDEKKEGE